MTDDVTFWKNILLAVASGLLGWAIAVERRIANRVHYRKYEADKAAANGPVMLRLTEIKTQLDEQDKEADNHRDRMYTSINVLVAKVAVLEDRHLQGRGRNRDS